MLVQVYNLNHKVLKRAKRLINGKTNGLPESFRDKSEPACVKIYNKNIDI